MFQSPLASGATSQPLLRSTLALTLLAQALPLLSHSSPRVPHLQRSRAQPSIHEHCFAILAPHPRRRQR